MLLLTAKDIYLIRFKTLVEAHGRRVDFINKYARDVKSVDSRHHKVELDDSIWYFCPEDDITLSKDEEFTEFTESDLALILSEQLDET